MRLHEFTNSPSFMDPKDNVLQRRHLDDTRKPKLTLKHLNKLRKMREAKKLDMWDRKQQWQAMYGIADEEEGMGGI